ncbi:hypothetical protein SPBR_01472 [Sporothrix brasiliensis 5110]|uniref:C3H1-type domain-containing protein n=1 Tax=Sporothrix brasiliensis 5110 TaxID=1398154 RepID=A0A0C2FK52_9PEZI|nr:uncharacterized protein SPBR_01472 [Sporothrix brasiliensis 5110]KIH91413.1 hypothetical protein SPBR_01472 [Sporothrix brasiliensis 5110]
MIGDELGLLKQRFQQLRHFEDSQSQLLEDLFTYSQQLESRLHTETSQLRRDLANCRLDLDDAQNSRRNFQQQVQALNNEIQQLKNENDEHRFQDSFVNDGVEGGKRAAHALRTAVVDKCGDQASKMEIIVKVWANKSGLATAMRQAGVIFSEDQFKQFTLGFTQAKASFDFIDVGYGKERADSKIREDARWHLHNANCKMVVLGISHDSGYAPFLDDLSSNYKTRDRLRILEGSPTVRELIATNIEVTNLNETVFRSDKLIADRIPNAAPVNPMPNGTGRASPAATNGQTVTAKPNGGIPNNDATKTSVLSPTKSPSISYASATTAKRSSPPPTMTFPQSTTKSLQAKAASAAATAAAQLEKNKPSWSPGERGLDPPVTYNPVVVDSVKKRKGKDKFCNNYVILGHCTKDYCEYNHKLKATADEKMALSFLMRQSPCSHGQDCAIEECIHGHHCPSVRDGNCLQPYCRFPSALHPPKTKFKQPFLGDD